MVQVLGGVISHANTNPEIDHGAVLVYSGRQGGDVHDVTISGLTISGTRNSASRQIGVVADGGNAVSRVTFKDLRLSADPTPYQGNSPTESVTLIDVNAAGRAITAQR
jgi:hypothetical protein